MPSMGGHGDSPPVVLRVRGCLCNIWLFARAKYQIENKRCVIIAVRLASVVSCASVESSIPVHAVCNTSRPPAAECSTRNLKPESAVSYRLVVSVRLVMLTCCDVDVGCSIYVFTDPRPSCCVCV